ncbi:hypothetical protein ACHAWF_013739 [Thalassiosira exigua]
MEAGVRRRAIAGISILALLCLLSVPRAPDDGRVYVRDGNALHHERQVSARGVDDDFLDASDFDDGFEVCGRPVGTASLEKAWMHRRSSECAPFDPSKTTLMLTNRDGTYGRTMNQLEAFAQAVQYGRDTGTQLAVKADSWAAKLITSMFLVRESNDTSAGEGEEWARALEEVLCTKVFRDAKEVVGWNTPYEWRDVSRISSKILARRIFYYRSPAPQWEYRASQEQVLRELFRRHNDGGGRDAVGRPAEDACAAVDALFGLDGRRAAKYSVVHLRHLEGADGRRLMRRQAVITGCDPEAALSMRPEYVKAILAPLGMLDRPVVIIHDGQNLKAIERLVKDPVLGPSIKVVPKERIWIGGDVALAVVADVFVGNPASSVSRCIGRARAALGLGNTFIYRARDKETGRWRTVCGDECLFRRSEEVYWDHGWPLRRDPREMRGLG